MSPGFPEPAVPTPQLPPPPWWQSQKQAARTKTSWLLGAVSIGVGAFWTWGLLVEALLRGGPPDGPVALLACTIFLLLGLPGLLLLILGVRFMRRPSLRGLESILTLLAFASGVFLTVALLVVWSRLLPEAVVLSASVFTASLLILPVHVLARVRCAALTGLARLNPWMAVGASWVVFLALQIWLGLTFFGYERGRPWLLRLGGSPDSADYSRTPASVTLHIILPLVLPILAAWLFARLTAWWLSRKARAWDALHPGADYPRLG
ncbi:MAG: hypothetical protein JWM59_200 [Verrucomicrobiales bacterium]|nr:hypothetical protein [Verrucomicrobiales bacterium]